MADRTVVVLDHTAWKEPVEHRRYDGRRKPPFALTMRRRFGGQAANGSPSPRDYRGICERWWQGATRAEIATEFDMSWEQARQAIAGAVPKWERALHEQVQDARRRLRLFVERGRPCRACGRSFAPGGCDGTGGVCGQAFYCCTGHREARLALRFHLDPEINARHRVLVARNHYEKNPTPEGLANLRRAETRTQKSQGRWLIPGSKPFLSAQQAYLEAWPIFDQLPEPVQAQVMASISRHSNRDRSATPLAG